MDKAQKRTLIIAVAIIVVAAVLVIWLALRKKKAAEAPAEQAPPSGSGSKPAEVYPLGLGSKNQTVKTLQGNLNKVIYSLDSQGKNTYGLKQLSTDGDWGPKTDNAFKTISGLVGLPLTTVASAAEFNQLTDKINDFISAPIARAQGESLDDSFFGFVPFINW